MGKYQIIRGTKPYNSQLLVTKKTWKEIVAGATIRELTPDIKKSELRSDRKKIDGKWTTTHVGLIEQLIDKKLLEFDNNYVYAVTLSTTTDWHGVAGHAYGRNIIYIHYESDLYGTDDDIYMVSFLQLTDEHIKWE